MAIERLGLVVPGPTQGGQAIRAGRMVVRQGLQRGLRRLKRFIRVSHPPVPGETHGQGFGQVNQSPWFSRVTGGSGGDGLPGDGYRLVEDPGLAFLPAGPAADLGLHLQREAEDGRRTRPVWAAWRARGYRVPARLGGGVEVTTVQGALEAQLQGTAQICQVCPALLAAAGRYYRGAPGLDRSVDIGEVARVLEKHSQDEAQVRQPLRLVHARWPGGRPGGLHGLIEVGHAAGPLVPVEESDGQPGQVRILTAASPIRLARLVQPRCCPPDPGPAPRACTATTRWCSGYASTTPAPESPVQRAR